MTTSDPIADMLTRIRNANTAKHDTVDVPSSKMKLAIAEILLDEGYIKKYELVDAGSFKNIHITLKYGEDKNEKIISGLKRISKPGLRVYAGKDELPKVLGGLGIAIISTNNGVVTDKEARKAGVGGEVSAQRGGRRCGVWRQGRRGRGAEGHGRGERGNLLHSRQRGRCEEPHHPSGLHNPFAAFGRGSAQRRRSAGTDTPLNRA